MTTNTSGSTRIASRSRTPWNLTRPSLPCYGAVAVDKRGQLTVSSTFVNSRWFTRGWTLQELLAPKNVVFFSQNWRPLGSKNTLHYPLAQITGVPADYLVGNKPLWAASVAERMSWMSKRVTQRAEDMAYSMLGIFNIFMPFSYGDGTGAFLRLQEAIMKKIDDHSIFCWEWDHTVDPSWVSVFAPSPRAFANSAKYSPKLWDNGDAAAPYYIRNGAFRLPFHSSKRRIHLSSWPCSTSKYTTGSAKTSKLAFRCRLDRFIRGFLSLPIPCK